MLSFDYYLYLFSIIFLYFVGRPLWVNWTRIKQILKQQSIWEELSANVGELTLDKVQVIDDEPTRFVLSCSLTNRPGIGKSQGITAALGHLDAALDAPLRALRSCSHLSVLVGLLMTVFVLTITFWEIQDIRTIKPSLLIHIYLVNFVAILGAAFIYRSYIHRRRLADRFLLLASETLGRLQTDVPEGVDPHLVAALERVGTQFTQWVEDIYARHQQHSERLVQEMQGLGVGLREMVQSMLAAQKTEVEGIIPLLRSQDEKVELLSQRLDERFQDLARPLAGC